MSVIAIQQPLLDGGIRSVNFFNGRLLSGEDLGKEQEGNRKAHERLGRSSGMGIVTGLNVTQSPPPLPGEQDPGPTVTVGQGMAINAVGQTLLLNNDIAVQLVNTGNAGSAVPCQGAFRATQPSTTGQDTLGAGLYLLTIAPAWGSDGFSPMGAFSSSGAGSSSATCNARYSVDAIQFRLIQLTFSSSLLRDSDHLRNRIAYRCFGFKDESPYPPPDSFGPFARNARLIEALQQDTAQNTKIDLRVDVPLAILRWSSGGHPDFIDMWSVRRRLIHPAFTSPWQDAIGDQRLAEAEAMFLQFQSQIDDIQQGVAVARLNAPVAQDGQTTSLNALSADQVFSYLPAAGYLPVGKDSFDWKIFLGSLAPSDITSVDRRFFRLILHNSFYVSPIKVGPYTDPDSTPSGEPPLDVYQDPSQSDFVLFARSNTGRVLVTVNAQGYQPANLYVSFTAGQQGQLTIPLTQDGPQGGQRPISVDADKIRRPALHRVRFSIVQQPAKASEVLSKKIRVDPLPQNVLDWLSKWKTWLNYQYPNQGIDVSTPAIYINDYYSPPKPGDVPQEPSAYAVFGEFAVPLLVNLHYFTTPLPVPLAKAGITGLADATVQALAGIGILYVDQVVGAWSQLIAHATGQSTEFGQYLIEDALNAVENLNNSHGYYEGFDARVEEVLQRLGIGDDVTLANADQRVLGESLKNVGLASRLIAQARQAVQSEHWSVQTLGLPSDQIPSLLQIGISSKGDFVKRAEDSQGHKQLESALQQDPHAIDQLYAKAIAQLTASSLVLAHIKDLIMLPNVNAQIATKLGEADINTVDEVLRTRKERLRQVTGLSADAVEYLTREAEAAQKEGLQVVKLAPVSKDVANVLDRLLQVKTLSQLLVQGEEKVTRALKATYGDRTGLFVKALFNGFQEAGR